VEGHILLVKGQALFIVVVLGVLLLLPRLKVVGVVLLAQLVMVVMVVMDLALFLITKQVAAVEVLVVFMPREALVLMQLQTIQVAMAGRTVVSTLEV
jgi:hypothetical protein